MQIIFYGALTCCFVVMSLQDQNFSILEISEKFLRAAPDAESEATLDMSNGCSHEEHILQASKSIRSLPASFKEGQLLGLAPPLHLPARLATARQCWPDLLTPESQDPLL